MKIEKQCILHRVSGEKKAIEVHNRVIRDKYYSDSVSALDANPPYVGFYFISFEILKVSQVCLGVRRRNTATATAQVKFLYIVDFDAIDISDLLDEDQKKRCRNHNDAILNINDSNLIVDEIFRINPYLKDQIDRIISIVNGNDEVEETDRNIKLAYQRDAIGLSAEIFSGEKLRNSLLQHMPVVEFDISESALELIDEDEVDDWEYVQESHLIEHDLETFDGYKYVNKEGLKKKILKKDDKYLAITITDRDAIENCLGVDLIYANLNKNTFVFIQYKKMSYISGGFKYYPDNQFEKERSKMSSLQSELNKSKKESINDYDNYRAGFSPLLFKFCKSLQLKIMNPAMVQGLYVPLDMWKHYVKTGPKTKSGKVVVRQGFPDKAFSNSAFVDLVSSGLLGTKREAFQSIEEFLNLAAKQKRNVVMAYEWKPNSTKSDQST